MAKCDIVKVVTIFPYNSYGWLIPNRSVSHVAVKEGKKNGCIYRSSCKDPVLSQAWHLDFKESYRPIEGGLFRSSGRTVLILQNASEESRLYDLALNNMPKPAFAELLITTDLTIKEHVAAQVTQLDMYAPIVIPPFSILHVVWK